MRGAGWLQWALGFVAGSVLASYLTLSCADVRAQSPEVAAAIHQAAQRYGVSEGRLLRISWCESRWTPWVTSRGGHQGLFQFAPRTYAWMAGQAGFAGTTPYDPWAAAHVAAWGLANGYAHHWSCR